VGARREGVRAMQRRRGAGAFQGRRSGEGERARLGEPARLGQSRLGVARLRIVAPLCVASRYTSRVTRSLDAGRERDALLARWRRERVVVTRTWRS